MQSKTEHDVEKQSAKELYTKYSAGILPVVVRDENGDLGIGSAFHVGSGSFVTARHVVEGKTDCNVEIDSFRHHLPLQETAHFQESDRFELIAVKPRFHPDSDIDVTVFSIPSLSDLPRIP
jgi:hypothetical protein